LGDRGVVNVEEAVQDVLEVRKKALSGAMGLADKLPIFLLGHGLGGLITIASAVINPRHVDGVIVIAPALPEPKSALASRTLDLTAKLLPKKSFLRAPSPVGGQPPPVKGKPEQDETGQAFEDGTAHTELRIPIIVAATATRVANKVWDRASTCDVPILILHGTNDVYADPAGSKRFFETVGSCDKHLSLYEDSGHEILNDNDQDHACFEILSWIDTRL
jgi:acylglycerol lipase